MLRRLTLSAKATLLLSLVVFGVVLALTYFMAQSSESVIEDDYRKRSINAADRLAAKLGEQPVFPSKSNLEDLLFGVSEKNLSITDISVFQVHGKEVALAATSSADETITASPDVRGVIESGKRLDRFGHDGKSRYVESVVPIHHVMHLPRSKVPIDRIIGCVSVHTSLEQADQIIEKSLGIAYFFAPVSILLLIIPLNVLFRFTVHKPVKRIQEAMARAEAGDLRAEVNLDAQDELGMIAGSYNRMLRQIGEATTERIRLIERINNFNAELKFKVDSATTELTERNRELRDLNAKLLKMQLELVHLERLAVAGQLTATFAHEVGTPLNLISGHVQLLIESFHDNETIARKLALVQSQIRRLGEIVRRLLDATRKPKLDLAPVDLNALVQNIATLIQPTLHSRHIQLFDRLDPHLPPIQADHKQLEQVLLNLINNSLDAMPGGGELRIETAPGPENTASIRITDTGAGIQPEHLERLFEPMFTTKEIGQGTGLGLSICRAIIKEHGGEIAVRSTPGAGTTFSILLPAEVPVLQAGA
ncbi:MAG: HAMP domain-containing protein [Acidimicrobiia bacterium]|nr:HAMP domain-containing protein [Acidimicrobiia bacterium]